MSSTPTLDAEYRKVITAKYLDKPCYTCGGKLVDGDYAATNTFSAWYSYCSKCASSFAAQVAALLARVEAKVAPLGSVLPANITDEVNKVTKYVEAVLNGSTDVVTAQSAKSGLFVILGLVEAAVATPDPLIDALKVIAATGDRDSGFAGSLVAGHAKYGSLTGPQRSAAERMITKRAAQAQQAAQRQQALVPVPHVETGLYRDDDGTIRRVYKTARSRVSSRKYNGVDFKYEGVEGLRVVAAGLLAGTTRLLNAIEASAFGRQSHRCFNCLSIGRPGRLSDDRSLAVGYGPDCAEHNGWWYPTADEAAQILRGTLDLDAKLTQALAAGIVMPAAPTEAEAEEIVESIVTGTPLDAELDDIDLYIDEDDDDADDGCPNCGRVLGTSNGVLACDNCGWTAGPPAVDADDEGAYRSRMSAEALAYEHGGTLYLDEIVDAVEPEAESIVLHDDEGRPWAVATVTEAAPVCACCGNEAGTVSFVCQDAQVFKVCPPCRVMLVRRPVCPFHGAE